MNPKIRSMPRGFTLLEVMIAMVILGIGLAAIMQSTGMSMRNAALTSRYTQATILAQNKLDEVLTRTEPPQVGESGTFEDYPGYDWTLTLNKGGIPDVVELRVKVGFVAPGGKRFVEYASFMARRTPVVIQESKDAKTTKDAKDTEESKESADGTETKSDTTTKDSKTSTDPKTNTTNKKSTP